MLIIKVDINCLISSKSHKMLADNLIALLKLIRRYLINIKVRLEFFVSKKYETLRFTTFTCNICGSEIQAPLKSIEQSEVQSCYHCGSTRRFRSIIASLTQRLYGEILTLTSLKNMKHISGIGLSDSLIYAKPLSKLFSYKNTYYHKEPKLDISISIPEFTNSTDFIIASEVFEHVPPPINIAFKNLYKTLKSGGICIFSVPCQNSSTTIEHFPDLYDYKIIKKSGKKILINKTRQGKTQKFYPLRFHGGRGATLEMRVFSRTNLMAYLQDVGFIDIISHDTSYKEFGIIIDKNSPTAVMSMRKP